MHKKKRDIKKNFELVKKELKKQKNEKFFELSLLVLALVSTSALFILLSINLVMTGYSTYLPSEAGSITEVELDLSYGTPYWHGLHGLALRVPGYTDPLFEDLSSGDISGTGLFFDCMQPDAEGGREVYASTSQNVDFSSLQPGDISDIDSYTGCSGTVDCASNTFLDTMWVRVGSNNITNVPSTYTYRWDGEDYAFDLGLLEDSSGNIVFVTHVEELQKGYNPNSTVNFQMLLPTPPNSSPRYHFFTDPYDECPEGGGLGDVIPSQVSGYVENSLGNPVENVSVVVAGITSLTNSQGFYNISMDVVEGNYNLFASAEGYDDYFSNVSITFSNNTVSKNITLNTYTPGLSDVINPQISGYVKDSSGNSLSGAKVSISNSTYTTNSTGYYSLSPEVVSGEHPIVSIKSGYNNYYKILTLQNSSSLEQNITMNSVTNFTTDNEFETGPYEEEPGEQFESIREQVETTGEDFWISTKEIKKEVRQNTFVEENIGIFNFKDSNMQLSFSLSGEITDFVELDRNTMTISPDSSGELKVTIYGRKELGTYEGTLNIEGAVEQEIPIKVTIVEKRVPVETLLMKVDLFSDSVNPGNPLRYKLSLQNLLKSQGYKIELNKTIKNLNSSEVMISETNEVEIGRSVSLLEEIKIPEDFPEGDYILTVEATHLNLLSKIEAPFKVQKPLHLYAFLGVPLWIYFALVSFISFMALNLFIYRKYQEKKKRYRISLDHKTLPKEEKNNLKLGKIAETNIPALLEPEKLKTHCIVAGATGMGKSISAQVLIEEALMKNVAVIVFDPTAQWSGMLRKCDDKKMMAHYPKFGLKPTDAKGFPGNIRQVTDAREIIEVKKFINPGQIQIFTLNKLDPQDMDIFVSNVIREIFRSDPKEAQELKVLLVFDEVHRLLSKFGGSGEGFLQIERACREFRKWGMGVVLISQVLSDFVGEVKANINTEVQTRTIEEGDLDRIKTKYGEEFLKSLVRAQVGVVLFQNAEYNKGKPYFVNFRPILHNTRRLSDEELEKYNKYNNVVDDLEYQIEQLEKEKVDVFDLKMELKLVKDKIMTGNFSVVDIYLEGLKPRIQKQWEKLGKKPKKREKKLADISEIKKSVEEAKKARQKFEEQTGSKKTEGKAEEKKEESPSEKQEESKKEDSGSKEEKEKK